MRFTIERIRLLVVVAAAVLVAALGVFLVSAKWKSRFSRHDMPERLAKDIEQEANGFSFVHAYGAHSQYKIHASKEVQLKDNRILLHEVRIELFGPDGSRVDQIAGDTFEYDQKSGLAIAEGPVEMVLTQPASATASAGKGDNAKDSSPAPKQIHVKTSAVTFDQDTGMVNTVQPVSFTLTQGFGSAVGATYDSQSGYLTLNQSVELTTARGADTVRIHAQHAEFDRGAGQCWLRAATADSRGAKASATQARIAFREDGTAERLDATDGFTLATATGGHVAAPTATMDFDEHNQPVHGQLEGGVTLDSVREGRTVHGTSPTAELEFAGNGELRNAHLERGVAFASEETRPNEAQSAVLHMSRNWHSAVADVDFRAAGKGHVEPATLRGTGGVVITSESRRGDTNAIPSRMVADEITSEFGPNSSIRSMTGVGHAGIEQTTATGTKQTANGDRLQARFAEGREQGNKGTREQAGGGVEGASGFGATDQVASAELDGHVTLFQQATAKADGQQQAPLRASAGKAVYEGTGEWLHLTMNPRVENSGLELTADEVEVSRQSGDAFARGNVKTTWTGGAAPGRQPSATSGTGQGTMALGGNGPAHVIASDAQLNGSTGEATFRGHARLWQQANSVSGPVIILNPHEQTLVARTTDPADPVRAVLLSAGGPPGMGKSPVPQGQHDGAASPGKSSAPSVIRLRGGDLWYSDAEHRATMHSGVLSAVVAETSAATSSSDEVDLRLMPGGENGGQAQVDRMTASGHVVLNSQTRRGTGQQLVYSSTTGEYVLTGTSSTPPKMSDSAQGSVTGEALIFHSRDDSVSIEGGGRETVTQTTAPEAHGK